MLKTRSKRLLLLVGDIALLYASLGITIFFRYHLALFPASVVDIPWKLHRMPFLFVHLMWIIVFYSAGMYDWERFAPRRMNLTKLVFRTMTVGTSVAVLMFYFIPAFQITPKTNLIIDAIISAALLSLWRVIFLKTISHGSKINILFFGNTEESTQFKEHIKASPSLGYKVEMVRDHSNSESVDLKSIIIERKIDLIIIVSDISQNQELLKIFYEVIPLGIAIMDFAEFYETIMGKVPVSLINESWFLENLFELNKRTFEATKRLLDILSAVILGIPTLLLVPFIALFIKTDSRGPILYYQKRIGKNGAPFYFIKFRSMLEGSDTKSGFKGSGDDGRHTRVGKILRKTYLDELPQLINILKGEMSLVGPRPERPEYVAQLKKNIKFYEIRQLVKPGITGWAQINMKNDASVEDAPEKLQYDLYYIKNRSIFMDLAIMVKTATILISRSGR